MLTPSHTHTHTFFVCLNRDGTNFLCGAGCASCLHVLFDIMLLPHTQTFRRALKTLVDSCIEIKSAPSVVQPIMAEFGGRCWRVIHECDTELLLIYKKHERWTAILMQSSLIWHILQCTIFSQQTQKKGKETSTVLKLYNRNLIVHKALEFDSFSFKILSPPLFLHTHF